MKKDVFLHEMKRMRSITFEHRRYLLEYKPTCLTDFETDKKTRFKNIEDAYENAIIEDKPLKKLVDDAPTVRDLWYPKDENGEEEGICFDDSGIQIFSPEEARRLWPEAYSDDDE